MKLNFDCVRDLMLAAEDIPYNENPTMIYFLKNSRLSQYSPDDIYYSMEKIVEAGFVKLRRVKTLSGPFDGIFIGITWEGHQFLDSIRSDTVWEKAKEKVKKTIGSTSLQVLSSVAVSIASKFLGL